MEENKKWSGNKKFRHNNFNNQNRNQSVGSNPQNTNNTSNVPKKQNTHNQGTAANASNNNNNNSNKNNNYRTGNSNYKPNNRNNNYKNYNNMQNNNNRNKPEKSIEEHEKEYLEKRKSTANESPLCPVCKEPIYIIETAIRHSVTGNLAHFDCILNELNSANELEKNEKIVYLGSGTFGIIQERGTNKNDRMKFFVRKRITYEDRKEKEEVNTDVDVEEVFDV